MADPLFSIIVPTYGRPGFLAEALNSVRRQTVQDFECIVVDDASPEAVRMSSYGPFRVVRRSRNGGPAAARNTGIGHARGRYITFLDDDDMYVPERLALALEGLTLAPVSICWRGNESDDRPVRNRTIEGHAHDVILEAEVPQLGQTAVDRSIVPIFDERFQAAEDTEWWLRLSSLAPVSTIQRIGFLFRRHGGRRHRNDRVARLRYRRLLLDVYADYFASRPRAAAYQWKRIGLMAHDLGDHATARAAFARSLSLRPEVRGLWHLARSIRVTGTNAPASVGAHPLAPAPAPLADSDDDLAGQGNPEAGRA